MKRFSCPLLLCLILAGCSDREEQRKLEFANSMVQHALDTWTRGGKPVELRSEDQPIEFYDDDWDQSAKLLEYEIRQTYMESDGTARCAVSLTVQRGKKPATKVKCTYQIVTEPKIIIGRDPMA